MRRALVALAVLTLAGCAMGPKPTAPPPTARINDVTVPYPLNRGYTLVEVDGRPTPRVRGEGFNWFVTMVPFADVEPGVHTFAVKRSEDGTSGKITKITASVEAGKQYRIDVDANGVPTIVEYDERETGVTATNSG